MNCLKIAPFERPSFLFSEFVLLMNALVMLAVSYPPCEHLLAHRMLFPYLRVTI